MHLAMVKQVTAGANNMIRYEGAGGYWWLLGDARG